MVTEAEKNEADILRTLRSRYERRGYTFVAHPTEDLIPEFLRGYRPDALAISERESVVIEIKTRRNPNNQKNLAQIAERVAGQPNWKFEIYYAGDFPRPIYERPNDAEISQLLEEIRGLRKAGFNRAALVMAWAALEAIARALRIESNGRSEHGGSGPMIPSEIVEWLSRTGHIDGPTGRLLRNIIKVRNAVVHGVQEVDLHEQELLVLYSTLESLVAQLRSKQTA
jgi:flagellar capping protein FliD